MSVSPKQVNRLLNAIDCYQIDTSNNDNDRGNDINQSIDHPSLGYKFADVLAFIDQHYDYRPVSFTNGTQYNSAGTNKDSAKIFGFAQLHRLSQSDTLTLFCEHYKAVLANPSGTDHPNIRNFRFWGWRAFAMPINPLTAKRAKKPQ